jgi:uncharacterized membrane protein YfcA
MLPADNETLSDEPLQVSIFIALKIENGITLPVCLGPLVFAFPGARLNAGSPAPVLNILLACIIIFAGAYALFPAKERTSVRQPGDRKQLVLLLGIGSGVGFASGLTGVGGPVLSVPVMVIAGFHPLTSIAASQVIQIAAASSGSFGNALSGNIHFDLAWWVTLVELAGAALGAHLAHSMPTRILKKIVSLVCIVVGACILLREVC